MSTVQRIEVPRKLPELQQQNQQQNNHQDDEQQQQQPEENHQQQQQQEQQQPQQQQENSTPNSTTSHLKLAQQQSNANKIGLKNKKKNLNNHTRKYKKKKSIGLSNDLEDIQEDVQSTNQIFSVNDFAQIISQQSNTVPSQIDDKIYIEGSARFKAKNRLKVDQKRAEELERSQNENADIYPTILSSQAIQIHKIFKTFSLFLSGLFAGIALWQIITSYVMYNNGIDNFFMNYSTLSAALQCFYYMLFAVCIVYALDRYDITHPSPHFWNKMATFQSGAFCIIIYIIGLIFSLAISNIEYRITFHQLNSSIIDPDNSRTTNMLYIWQILNLIRGLMAIIGWMIISVKPQTDRLLKALSNYKHTANSDPALFAANLT